MRWDVRKFEGPGEGQWENCALWFVHGSVVVLLG